MKPEWVAPVLFTILFVILIGALILVAIGWISSSMQEQAMLDCMNSAIHSNRTLSVEEAAKICWGG